MIATVEGNQSSPCVVRWTGRVGLLSVKIRTWCDDEYDAADGVSQLPESFKLCSKCRTAIDRAMTIAKTLNS